MKLQELIKRPQMMKLKKPIKKKLYNYTLIDREIKVKKNKKLPKLNSKN